MIDKYESNILQAFVVPQTSIVLACFSFATMELVRRGLALLGWQPTVARPIAFQFSSIGKLPNELILQIASYLTIQSATSLSISCYRFYNCLNKEHIAALNQADRSIQENFLVLLERDLPTHILCPHCNKLHPISNPSKHLPSQRPSQAASLIKKPWLECWKADLRNGVRMGIHAEFSSTLFRMAMKFHRQGRDTGQLLYFLSYDPITKNRGGFVEQCRATAQINDNSLLVREQRVFMVPSSQRIPVPWHGGIHICAHMHFPTILSLHMYGVVRIPQANELETFKNRRGLVCCKHCYTEFRVDFKSYGKSGNAMFITSWMDLGEGQDLNDMKFTCRRVSLKEETWTKVKFQAGSICAAFEQKAASDFEFDSLLSTREEQSLCKESPLPWPENISVSCDRVERPFTLRSGRSVPI